MVSTEEVGNKLVALCKEGKNLEAIETLYSPDIESVEACAMPPMPQAVKGIDAVLGKNKWWTENHEIHSATISGPFPNGDRFAVLLKYDVTNKALGQRMQMEEVGLYTVNKGKVVKEEFFYNMGQ